MNQNLGKHQWKVLYKDCSFYSNLLTNMTTIGNSFFWLFLENLLLWSFLKAEWKASDTGSPHWASSLKPPLKLNLLYHIKLCIYKSYVTQHYSNEWIIKLCIYKSCVTQQYSNEWIIKLCIYKSCVTQHYSNEWIIKLCIYKSCVAQHYSNEWIIKLCIYKSCVTQHYSNEWIIKLCIYI
jgi:hypothetical protein